MVTRPDGAMSDSVQTARTLFDVIECLKDGEGLTLAEAAERLDYAKSTVHRHLRTLESLGYVVERNDGYHVGLRFLDLGVTARNSHSGYTLIRAKVEEIAEETGERAQFFVREHDEAVYLARALGDQAVLTDPGVGSRIPLHATSAGKAILAALPEDELFDILERSPLESMTAHTITDPDDLLEEIESIRARGYAFNREESLQGTNAIGVAITDPDGGVIGGLSVTGPSHRLKDERLEEELPDLLLGAANELELNIAYS